MAKGRQPLTAQDYEKKLAESEAKEEEIMARMTRDLGRLKKTRKKSSYYRRMITERT